MAPANIGIVFSGGGARGAYQAGVLRGISEIIGSGQSQRSPFNIISGVSAGAINAAYLAAQNHQFSSAVQNLAKIWEDLRTDQVLNISWAKTMGGGMGMLFRLGLSGLAKRGRSQQFSLLDNSPLASLLDSQIDFSSIKERIAAGDLKYLALSALNYKNSYGTTFVMGANPDLWKRARRRGIAADIDQRHVMASTAIPLFFAPVKIEDNFYGDGCLRNFAPLAPAIHLGAERLLVIGVRQPRPESRPYDKPLQRPGFGTVLNTVINSIFLDNVDADLERLERINRTLAAAAGPPGELRAIETLTIRPSQDIGAMARKSIAAMPRRLRYFINGLGANSETADIVSYLFFEGAFCSQLVSLGHQDALAQATSIADFLKT